MYLYKNMTSPFKKLPTDVIGNIKSFHCPRVHPAAALIKELTFDRDESGERGLCNDGYPSLYVRGNVLKRMRKCGNRACWMCAIPHWGCRNARDVTRLVEYRRFLLTDFSEPDRYIEDSNLHSEIHVGRVL